MQSQIQYFQIDPSWRHALGSILSRPEMASLAAYVAGERAAGKEIYPPEELVFNALKETPFDQVKVVIVGQDPYHGPGQAHGLCFSVPEGVPFPPSLQNVFKELQADLGIPIPSHGCLLAWAKQGILLLNTTLTVRRGEPLSHQGRGWEMFTDAVIEALCCREDPVIFVLWGKAAQEKCRHVLKHPQHQVLTAAHPSPFSAHQGFFGCRHFSKINALLQKMDKSPINWQL